MIIIMLDTQNFLQHSRRIIDDLQERIQDLERINADLECRLEEQARICMLAERECLSNANGPINVSNCRLK
jgi:hypothetical protein